MVRGGVKQDNDMGQRTKGMSTAQLRKGSLDKPAGFFKRSLDVVMADEAMGLSIYDVVVSLLVCSVRMNL